MRMETTMIKIDAIFLGVDGAILGVGLNGSCYQSGFLKGSSMTSFFNFLSKVFIDKKVED